MRDFRTFLKTEPVFPLEMPKGIKGLPSNMLSGRKFGGQVPLKDGMWMSVQANEFTYCRPRTHLPDDHDPMDYYTAFEIAIIDPAKDGLIDVSGDERFKDYEWASRWGGDTVAGYVPTEVIQQIYEDIGLEHPFMHQEIASVSKSLSGFWVGFNEDGKPMLKTEDEDEARVALDREWRHAVLEVSEAEKNGNGNGGTKE